MILILFQIGNDTFGLETSRIIEVAPLLVCRKVPHVPEYVAGLINYRGAATPVIDLSILHCGQPSRPLLSTRIILTAFTAENGKSRTLGMIAEHVTETFSCRREDFQPPRIQNGNTRYLGDILLDGSRMIQLVTPGNILSAEVMELLDAVSGGE